MKSITLPLAACLIVLCVASVSAQDQSAARELTLRGYLHDPVHAAQEPFVFKEPGETGGKETPLVWRVDSLSEPTKVRAVKNTLFLHLPDGEMAATITVEGNVKSGIVIVFPSAGPGTGLPFRMVLIDDDPARFPFGTSKVLNMTDVQAKVEAGEHKVGLEPGSVSTIPKVLKVDDFKMAQTNFHAKKGDAWQPITERRLQFMDHFRRVFFIFSSPGSLRPPSVKTLLDNKPLEVRENP